MKYVDFDGVIMDTHDALFESWFKKPDYLSLSEDEKIKYIQRRNWRMVINQSMIINDAIYILKHCDYRNTAILTKVHSLRNEAAAKIDFLRGQGIKQSIIIVPFGFKKTDVVEAEGCTLIDDCIANLDDWELDKGTGIFFNKDGLDFDNWGSKNVKPYQKILTLGDIDRL